MIFLAALLLWPMIAQASSIRDSSVIAVVRIETSDAHPWAAGPKQMQVRTVDLGLAVERTLKGRAAAQHFHITVEQSQPGPRETATPGPWSGRSIEPGARYILFSRTELSHADRVEPVESESTVRLALDAESTRDPLGDLLARAPVSAPNPLFGEYVLDRLGEAPFSDYGQFDVLLSYLESPGPPEPFRRQVLSGIFTMVMNADPAPQRFWSRLAVSGFRVAALKQAEDFRDAILSTYLPNLVGLSGGLSPKSANQVFQNFPGDRLTAREQAAGRPLLMKWLQAR
jgi:hypothetical protein